MCVAGDASGNVFTTLDPTAVVPTWARAQADPTPADLPNDPPALQAVSCPATTLCVAVDSYGSVVTSTDPQAGASAAWSIEPSVDDGSLEGLVSVSCASSSLCLAAGANGMLYTSTDPAAGAAAVWSPYRLLPTEQVDPLEVACAAASLCIAADFSGAIATSGDPADGASATWSISDVDDGNAITALTCPSTSLCVGVDDAGDVLTSIDPASGVSATWNVAYISDEPLIGISCESTTLCIASDDGGDVFTSTDPAAGADAAWVGASVDPYPLTGVACVSSASCLGIDAAGFALTGAPMAAPQDALTVGLAGSGSGAVAGPGILCPSACAQSYAAGAAVTLSATPAAGSTFAGWSGACSGSGDCTVSMTAARSVSATFEPTPSTQVAAPAASATSSSASGPTLPAGTGGTAGGVAGSPPRLAGVHVGAGTLRLTGSRRGADRVEVTYTDTQAAQTSLIVYALRAGVERDRRCAAVPTHGARAGAADCTRRVAVERLTHADHVGANHIEVGGGQLAPGRYVIVLSAHDAAGTSAAASVALRVLA